MTDEPRGWESLRPAAPSITGTTDAGLSIPAYSEFMPAPSIGWKPYGWRDPYALPDLDPEGLGISEYEQAYQLAPGLQHLARHLQVLLRQFVRGQPRLSRSLLTDNPYWPPVLAGRALPAGDGRRHLLVLPLSLSRTQDDKGRVRWTLFGCSEQGPARPFWNSFRTAAGAELPPEEGRALLQKVASLGLGAAVDLQALRVLPAAPPDRPVWPDWGDEALPSWVRDHPGILAEDGPLQGLRCLWTFRPFGYLPAAVQAAVLAGTLELLPSPAGLVFFGHRGYHQLGAQLGHAVQIPLLHQFPRERAAATGIRIPQSGWLEEPRRDGRPAAPHGHRVVNQVQRTHRWDRVHRDEDEEAVLQREEHVAHVLFSHAPDDLGLYDKPMARNAQLWTADYRLLLDGPRHPRHRLDEAALALRDGGHFGYRFFFPPMRIGAASVYWQLPLCAAAPAQDTGEPAASLLQLGDGPTGYFTAYLPDRAAPVLLWPRLLQRPGHAEAATLFPNEPGRRSHTTAYNVRLVLSAHDLLQRPVPASLARSLVHIRRDEPLTEWLDGLPAAAADPARGAALRQQLGRLIDPGDAPGAAVKADAQAGGAGPPHATIAHTFDRTATRDYEERYYRLIAELSAGQFRHKDNADPAGPGGDHGRACDLPALGEFLLTRHRALIAHHGLTGRALAASQWFRWRTECDLPWAEGWCRNQTGRGQERNLVIMIPGQDRSQAVIMADHYDTAYMEDVYEPARGGDRTRSAAAGADDNHSATAALLMAADVLLPLSRQGLLQHDVWLVHLTGEEFPADCLGARNLVQRLLAGSLALEAPGVGLVDVSGVRLRGAYVLDMVAHNSDRERYVFQIAPGEGPAAMHLAELAHQANQRWNRGVETWNRAPDRRAPGPSERLGTGAVPAQVAHPRMIGEVRPGWHFRSSLYNTDGQIFSDAGIPVVLFMEDYDINRSGYHDSHDTLDQIDLDYGAALSAIAIESVAAAAGVGP